MIPERPRKPDPIPVALINHTTDALNELSDLNNKLSKFFEQHAKLAERQKLIKLAVVETALNISEAKQFEWEEQEEDSYLEWVGKANLEIFYTPFNRLLTLLVGETSADDCLKLQVNRHKARQIMREDRPTNYHQMEIKLSFKNRNLRLNLEWDDDKVNPQAKVEFNHSLGTQPEAALARQQVNDPMESWRHLEDACQFLSILEQAKIVPSQESKPTEAA